MGTLIDKSKEKANVTSSSCFAFFTALTDKMFADVSIARFFAAPPNPTVVVGTVIDPEMDEDLKVTVVATGLSDETVKIPLQVVSERVLPDHNRPDYGGYDLPADRRKSSVKNREKSSTDLDSTNQGAEEYFDIPAFLRKQAD